MDGDSTARAYRSPLGDLQAQTHHVYAVVNFDGQTMKGEDGKPLAFRNPAMADRIARQTPGAATIISYRIPR